MYIYIYTSCLQQSRTTEHRHHRTPQRARITPLGWSRAAHLCRLVSLSYGGPWQGSPLAAGRFSLATSRPCHLHRALCYTSHNCVCHCRHTAIASTLLLLRSWLLRTVVISHTAHHGSTCAVRSYEHTKHSDDNLKCVNNSDKHTNTSHP